MDFFSAQDQARRNTGRLVLLFGMAVVSLIVMTNLMLMVVLGYVENKTPAPDSALQGFNWEAFAVISIGVLAVVGLGSLYKIIALSDGGSVIAEMVGGRLLVDAQGDPDLQKVLNVVEEMAIASGTPVPPVYLLDEEGINAFAAGYTPGDAVIGVTRGAIKKLSRDELQGVIAHEFSHIHNGDMRLNIRLMGNLHGILLLGMIGYYLIRIGYHVMGSSGVSRKEGGGTLAFGVAMIVIGLGLVVVGFTGTFFGNLIKAAVSRQREYLADASAVQFTRNPDGIGGALLRIGSDSAGSVLKNNSSAEISHALFSQGFTSFFDGLFATHPPLEMRIKKIIPNWDGKFEVKRHPTRLRKAAPNASMMVGNSAPATTKVEGIDSVTENIGTPTMAHLGYARQLIEEIPDVLRRAVHEPFVARAVIYCLVLDHEEEMCRLQLAKLEKVADVGVYEETIRLKNLIQGLKVEYRLPLIDMALPALRQLSKSQYALFKNNLKAMIEADSKLSLFEWTLEKIVLHHLDRVFAGKSGAAPKKTNLKRSGHACSVLLSLLAYSNRHEGMTIPEVFAGAVHELDGIEIKLLAREKLSLKMLNSSVNELAGLHPQEMAKLIKACSASILADGKIAPVEAELFRAIAGILDCPMPPLVV